MDSGAVKELSMKSSKCHPNPLEPEGEQPVVKMADNKNVTKYEEQLSKRSEYSGGAGKSED